MWTTRSGGLICEDEEENRHWLTPCCNRTAHKRRIGGGLSGRVEVVSEQLDRACGRAGTGAQHVPGAFDCRAQFGLFIQGPSLGRLSVAFSSSLKSERVPNQSHHC